MARSLQLWQLGLTGAGSSSEAAISDTPLPVSRRDQTTRLARFMVGPMELLASGRDADVYALDGRRVLRRYRKPHHVEWEVAAMRLAGEAGYPVPEVHEATNPRT